MNKRIFSVGRALGLSLWLALIIGNQALKLGDAAALAQDFLETLPAEATLSVDSAASSPDSKPQYNVR